MKKSTFSFLILIVLLTLTPMVVDAETIDVLIKGVDDGVKTNKQQDYKEAVMNAKLEAIERAGVEISSITKVVNFRTKYDMVESKAEATLLPGFQVMDMGYQSDGTYAVVLSGKLQVGKDAEIKDKRRKLAIQKEIDTIEDRLATDEKIIWEAEIERADNLIELHQKMKEINCSGLDTNAMTQCYNQNMFLINSVQQTEDRAYNRKTKGLREEQAELRLKLSELRMELAKYPPDAELVLSPPSSETKVYATMGGTYILPKPKFTGQTSETVEEGTELMVLGKMNEWYKVRTLGGTTGWVFESWVDLEPPQN